MNQAPTFSSGLTAAASENTPAATVIYQAAASDPEGSPVNFAIAGGPDAARFTMTSGGELRFAMPPDFDLPGDSDQDSIYEVQIAASDGTRDSRQTVRVTVSNDREGFGLGFWCNFRGCTSVSHQVATTGPFATGNGPAILVASKEGTLSIAFAIDDVGPAKAIPGVATDGERGIISMTPAPDFNTSGNVYVMYTETTGDIVVQRFPREFVNGVAPGPVILRIPHGQYNNNLGGWLGFGPDGRLYVATGDGGGSGDPLNTAQDTSSRLGKVLRFSADFSTVATIAIGLRNPNGGSFYNGNLILADRGESSREELNIIPLDGVVRNYGWPYKEGTLTVRAGGPAGLVDPLAECAHEPGSRGCYRIVGGLVDTRAGSRLEGQYVFGDRDYVNPSTGGHRGGFIFTLPATALVFGQPTIQASSFTSRTLDIFSGFPASGIPDPSSFVLASHPSTGTRIYITQFQFVYVSYL